MIKFNKKYRPILDPAYRKKHDIRYVVMTGGRGSGKSYVLPNVAHDLSFIADNVILVSRFTMNSASISVVPEFAKSIEARKSESFFIVNNTNITNTLTGSNIIFKGMKAGSKAQTAGLKSITDLNVWILDEAEELHDEEAFNDADETIRRKGYENLIILSLNTYRIGKNHFIYKRFFLDNGINKGFNGIIGNTLYIHTTYLDNITNLSKSFIEIAEKSKREYTDKEIIRFNKNDYNYDGVYYSKNGVNVYSKRYYERYLGHFPDVPEGLVYPKYNIVDSIPADAEPIPYGLDFGFSNDPNALVDIYYKDGALWLDELIYRQGMNNLHNDKNPEIPSLEKSFEELNIDRERYIIADNNEPKTISVIRQLDYSIVGTTKYKGSVVGNIKSVSEYELNVTSRSLNMIFEFDRYAYGISQNNKGEEVSNPIKKHDHLMNAIGYAVASRGRYW